MDEYFASDIMKKRVVTIDSSSVAADAAKKMADDEIGCLIVTEGGIPVGIVTERDLVRMIARKDDLASTQVKKIMSSPLIHIDPDSTIWELAEKMKLEKIHRIPVIRGKDLVGIVTTTDITRLCSIGSDSEMKIVCQQILQRLNQA
ncbi:MAG: CBS domain-containing protein [Thaumarchaeota archaeon]|nr:CBS domain-containing protein [Nitrososphaerota archaeon]